MGASPCAAEQLRRGISCGALPSVSSPSEVASRRAGSMVRTTVRRPWSAPHSASDAATVVFPTPPLPADTTMRWPATTSREIHERRRTARAAVPPASAASSASGEPLERLGAELLDEEERQLDQRRVADRPRAGAPGSPG